MAKRVLIASFKFVKKKTVKWPREHIKVELNNSGMCVSQDCLRYFGKCLKIPSIFSVSIMKPNSNIKLNYLLS